MISNYDRFHGDEHLKQDWELSNLEIEELELMMADEAIDEIGFEDYFCD